MVPVLAPALPDLENAAALCARALSIRHRQPDSATELAERAVAAVDGTDVALLRRVDATLGACLAVTAAEVAHAREILRDVLARCEAAGDDALRCEVLNELAGIDVTLYALESASSHARAAVDLARTLGRRDEEARAAAAGLRAHLPRRLRGGAEDAAAGARAARGADPRSGRGTG